MARRAQRHELTIHGNDLKDVDSGAQVCSSKALLTRGHRGERFIVNECRHERLFERERIARHDRPFSFTHPARKLTVVSFRI
jgi:hypothetical protein